MITLKIKYNQPTDPCFIDEKIKQFNLCIQFLYKKIEEIEDKNLFLYCKERFKINDIELRSAISKIKQIKLSHLDKINKTQNDIELIEDDINELSLINNKTLKQRKYLYRLYNKLFRNKKFINSQVVFGSRKLLSKISFLSNNKEKNIDLIKQTKKEYLNKRFSQLYLLGEANQKGNRFFDFNFENNIIVYKPYKGKKIELNLCNYKNKNLKKLQELINTNAISVTVSLSKDHICISYDETILSGYCINKSARTKEVKEKTFNVLNEDLKNQIIKQVYKKHYDILREKKLINKKENRFISIDMNPDYLSFTIGDSNLISKEEEITNTQKDFNIIKSGCFDLTKINKKSNQSSDCQLSIYLSNKRKHEKKEIICYLFKLIKHYKVSKFVIEDLDFKPKVINNEYKEFNRKVKNIWDRNLIIDLINKKCNENGIELIDINPVYTSLIGNLSYEVFDAVASSIEILRRGIVKYIKKSSIFPLIDETVFHTMETVCKRLQIDVEEVKGLSWKGLHTIFKEFRYRWGESVGKIDSLSVGSYRSGVIINYY